MDCASIRQLLNAYLDGELEGVRFAELERHLGQCAECKAELDRLVKVRDLLKDLKEVPIPPGEREAFINVLRARLEAEGAPVYAPRRDIRPALVASLVFVLALIAVAVVPQRLPSTRIAPAPGLNAIENLMVDRVIGGALDDHFISTSGEFLADPGVSGGQALAVWKVLKDTHGELFEPAQ